MYYFVHKPARIATKQNVKVLASKSTAKYNPLSAAGFQHHAG